MIIDFSLAKVLTKKTILQFFILFMPGVTLLMSFQNCAPVQFESISDVNSLSSGDENEEANPRVCASGESEKCRVENGDGVKECKPDLSGFDDTCRLMSCDVGFSPINGKCEISECSNGAMNAPNCNDCGDKAVMIADKCVAKICEPEQVEEGCLIVEHGKSRRVCNEQGTGYGACEVYDCEVNYQIEGLKCVASACGNGALNPPECNDCGEDRNFDGQFCIAKVCVPDSEQECEIAGGIGKKVCNKQGSDYGTCILDKCDNNHTQSGDICVPKTCTNGAINYSECNQCPAGQIYNGSSCVGQTCTPNSTKSCLIQNGTGLETCNADGSAYGTCTVKSCNPNFKILGNSCVAETCSNGATNYPSCNSCQSGQYYNGSKCVAQTCTPNSTKSCLIQNGTGLETCNTEGSAYGACTVKSCNPNFKIFGNSCVAETCSNGATNFPSCNTCNSGQYYNSSKCVAQTCTPNSTKSCLIQNGTGLETCNADGSAYGACTVKSCNPNFKIFGNSCVAETCSNGATNFPSCNACQNGFAYDASSASCKKNIPDNFGFIDLVNQDVNVTITSNEVPLTGFVGPLIAGCFDSNCIAISRNGVWGGAQVTGFMPGDTIAIRMRASDNYGVPLITNVYVGTAISKPWSVKTRDYSAANCQLGGVTVTSGSSIVTYKYTTGNMAVPCMSEQRRCNDGSLTGSFANHSCDQTYRAILPLFCSTSGSFAPESNWTGANNSTVQGWYNSINTINSKLTNRCADYSGMDHWANSYTTKGSNETRTNFNTTVTNATSNPKLCFVGDTYLTNTPNCVRKYSNIMVSSNPIPARPNYLALRDIACSADINIENTSLQTKIIDIFKSSATRCPDRGGLEYWVKDKAAHPERTEQEHLDLIRSAITNNPSANTSFINSLCLLGDTYQTNTMNCLSNGRW